MQYLILFLEGITTFISPCLLPMLPIYISYFAADDANRRRALVNALAFVLGFTLVFVTLGAFAGTLGALLLRYETVVHIVTGVVVILLGLNFTGVIKFGLFKHTAHKGHNVENLRFRSSLLFGMVFSMSWTPCMSAFLGSALMMASQQGGGVLTGMTMLLAYSLGLGIPFVASALLLDRLKGAFDFLKRHNKVVNMVSGILLIILGVLMATGLLERLMSLLAH